MRNPETTQVSLWLPGDLARAAKELAAAQRISMTELSRRALAAYMAETEHK